LASLLARGPAWALIIGCTLLHALVASQIQLSPDEAHYALYAAHLDWSYFDHPPLVGWLQWPFVQLGGADLLLRIVPMGCWVLTAVGLLRLCDALFPAHLARVGGPVLGRRASPQPGWSCGAVAVLLYALSPLQHLLGVALIPDTLMSLWTVLVMAVALALGRRLRADLVWVDDRSSGAAGQSTRRLWGTLGLLLGLAALSKYTAVYLAFGSLAVLWRACGARLLRQPGFWCCAVIACLLAAPVLVWNAAHQWVSFAYQLHHAGGEQPWHFGRMAGFVALQWVLYGLLLGVGLWGALRRGAWRAPGARREAMFLGLAFGLPCLATVAVAAGRGSAMPYWTAFAWVALLPAAASGLQSFRRRRVAVQRALQSAVAVQALLCVAAATALMTAGWQSEVPQPGALGAPRPAANPVADLYGWQLAAAHAAGLARQHHVSTLAVMNWSLASRIAWYARPWPVEVLAPHFDQFTLWFGAMQAGQSAVWVDWSMAAFASPVGPQGFAQCQRLDTLPVVHAGRQIAHFNFWLCRGWQQLPSGPVAKAVHG
jgi:4-amino-4-deoxy-L-arabinose transferase-like glycosyltransferase